MYSRDASLLENTKRFLRVFPRFLIALSLLLLSFAHQPLSLENNATDDLSRYLLPDRNQTQICLSFGVGENGPGDGQCDACRLASSVGLPAAPDIATIVSVPRHRVNVRKVFAGAPRTVFFPSAAPRAPPVA